MSDSGTNSAPRVVGRDLTVVYHKRTVLDVGSVTIPAGKTYALLGSSGAGKSTLMRVLGMLERPSTGTVTFDDEVLDAGSLSTRRRIAAVFQKPHLMRGTVEDNVAYGLKLRGIHRDERARRVREQLERMGIPGWEKRSALTLSGGEAQRVALARALVLQPDLLLLDEPLSYLDPLLRRQLTVEFGELLANQHLTTLYVTHDRDEAVQVADHLGVMRDGQIVAEGAPDEVLALPSDVWVAEFLDAEMPSVGIVEQNDGGVLRIRCAGETAVLAEGELPVGEECIFGVRPEDIALSPVNGGTHRLGYNQLEARIIELRPNGSMVSVRLAAPGLRLGAAAARSTVRALGLCEGQPVMAEFAAGAVVTRKSPNSSSVS
ncbi:MAG TPA: ABC transporter ATP-binding protein [Coriobacteriia bacterium]|nr:ABC transporter ATP-binding protein [Coriobacteriia bacterium]